MILKNISFNSPQDNICYDEALLTLAERGEGGEALRFWESSELFIVLGRIGKAEEDLKIDEVKKDAIPVLRRASGGGTVLQGKGCLNYSLVLSKDNPEVADLKKSYVFVLSKVVKAVQTLNINAQYLPISDIALIENQKKFSGNAQKRSIKFILHHGTLLYNFDLALIEQYLTMSKDRPQYRGQRSHLEFVTNINVSAAALKTALKKEFAVEKESNVLSDVERNCLKGMKSRGERPFTRTLLV